MINQKAEVPLLNTKVINNNNFFKTNLWFQYVKRIFCIDILEIDNIEFLVIQSSIS